MAARRTTTKTTARTAATEQSEAPKATATTTAAAPEVKYTLDKGAYPPERAHATDAGLDIRSRENTTVVPARGSAIFYTGIHMQIPHGYAGLLVSKSGLNVKFGITSTGLIDEGYTGEIVVKLYNDGFTGKIINKGDKISQLMLIPVLHATPTQVDELDASERGENGFGSTGN